MKQPTHADTVVKVRAFLSDEDFGYEHWKATQFASPQDRRCRPSALVIFDTDAERDAFILGLSSPSATPAAQAWQAIETAPKEVVKWRPVDLWMTVPASLMSFGMSDQFRVTDCWRNNAGKWVHDFRGKPAELNAHYITHWMPLPSPPVGSPAPAKETNDDVQA